MTIETPTDAPSQARSRIVFLVLVGLFIAPVLLAVVLNSQWTDWQPEPTRNYGRLLDPVTPLPAALREDLAFDGGWTLIVDPARCGAECGDLVDRLHRLDRALGRHAEEVRQLILGAPPVEDGVTWPDVELAPRPDSWSALSGETGEPGALLVDPLGNAMLAYPADFDTGRMRKDLDRLLKYSRFNE